MPVKTTVTDLGDSRVRLDAEVTSDEVESRLQRTATALGRQLRIPGFRKGKVPAPMVIQRVGREAVLEETIKESLPEWYEKAILGADVKTVGDPKLNVSDLPSPGEPLTFSIEVAVTPKAKLGRYKGLEVGRREPEVPQEAIDREVERLGEALARVESVDRPAGEGDFVVVDFVGKVDDEPFQGGEARDYMLELGSGRLIEGFEEQLIGSRAGEQRTVKIQFPDEYPAEELQGKPAVFDVVVKDVKEKQMPALDDDFASESSEFDTIEELRADMRQKLEQAQEASLRDEFREAVVDAVAAEADLELGDELVSARAKEMWERTEHALEHQNINPETYLQAAGKTREEVIEEAKPDAAQQLARESVLEAIAEAEAIEVSDEELLEMLRGAEDDGASAEEMLESLRKSGRDSRLRHDLRLRKAADVVVENATPIPIEQAKAREKLWTPDKEREEGASQLWTPGAGPEAGASGGRQTRN